eukprot:601491-Hanusia_phi.AAC.1
MLSSRARIFPGATRRPPRAVPPHDGSGVAQGEGRTGRWQRGKREERSKRRRRKELERSSGQGLVREDGEQKKQYQRGVR